MSCCRDDSGVPWNEATLYKQALGFPQGAGPTQGVNKRLTCGDHTPSRPLKVSHENGKEQKFYFET